MPLTWSKVQIRPSPSGEFHMPHRCACCGTDYALSRQDLQGNPPVPVWYCMMCASHQARLKRFTHGAIFVFALAAVAAAIALLATTNVYSRADERSMYAAASIPLIAGVAALGVYLIFGGLLA